MNPQHKVPRTCTSKGSEKPPQGGLNTKQHFITQIEIARDKSQSNEIRTLNKLKSVCTFQCFTNKQGIKDGSIKKRNWDS